MTPLKKPVRRLATVDPSTVPFNVNPNLIVSLYPGGVLGIRESRHRKEHYVHVGVILERLMVEAALAKRREREKVRRAFKIKRALRGRR
jgi:hypothetical protein